MKRLTREQRAKKKQLKDNPMLIIDIDATIDPEIISAKKYGNEYCRIRRSVWGKGKTFETEVHPADCIYHCYDCDLEVSATISFDSKVIKCSKCGGDNVIIIGCPSLDGRPPQRSKC